MNNKRFISSILEVLMGIALLVCGLLKIIDEFWSGMGTAFIAVGVMQLIRQIRYKTNEKYKEDMDISVNDERNRFLSMKAWSWTGYLFVLICAAATIILKIAGYEDLMMLTSGSICLLLLLYWSCYLILRRKY